MFVPGDVIFFVYLEAGEPVQTGGVVIALDDALLTVALPHGIELVNMRSPVFARAWLVEHAPRAMTPSEADAYSREKLRQLAQRPPVLVHPLDEGYREPHDHAGERTSNGHTHV